MTVGDTIALGGQVPTIIAGPCAVESRQQILECAHAVKAAGAHLLRGGAFKPRTSPYAFQGLGVEALSLLAEAGRITNLPIVTEVMDPAMVETVAEYAHVLQIGSRNMYNIPLLRAVGNNRPQRPVLLKRGLMATIDEWLLAAEYIMVAGNPQVILCERGVRSFDTGYTRNVLDLSCVPMVQQLTHLPVIVDPSHATGRADLVPIMCCASIAAGASGLMLEVHPNPEAAYSDSRQALTPKQFQDVVRQTSLLATMMSHESAFAREARTSCHYEEVLPGSV
ncbi:MAG: hypothetical protein NVSMB27_26790 [Ktedonobacteraceae bacterium]